MARVLIAGDFIARDNHRLFTEGKIEQLFAPEILELFQNADFSLCNLEGALTNSERKIPKCGWSMKSPPETVTILRQLGVDCVTLANNHSTDYGTQGYLDTCEALDKCGIQHFGAGKDIHSIQTHYSVTVNGIRMTFYSVAETVFNIPGESEAGANLYDEYRVCSELKALKADCDYLFVIYHGGLEFFQYPSAWLVKRFHRMADCGADFITAQHTHCIGAMEKYNGAYLLYGQGNFYLVQDREITKSGLLLELLFSNGSFEVKHHLLRRDGDRVIYDKGQDLSDFYERSRRVAAGETFDEEFSAYCREWTLRWLPKFRGKNISDRVMRKILSKEQYNQYLRKSYSDLSVLWMMRFMRCEENLEILQRGFEDFYKMK